MEEQFYSNLSEELMRNLSARYQNNGNRINMAEVIEESKYFIAVNLLIIQRNTGKYNDNLLIQFLFGVEKFLKEKFKEFTDIDNTNLKIDTQTLLKDKNIKNLINNHYNELYGDDGIDVI